MPIFHTYAIDVLILLFHKAVNLSWVYEAAEYTASSIFSRVDIDILILYSLVLRMLFYVNTQKKAEVCLGPFQKLLEILSSKFTSWFK